MSSADETLDLITCLRTTPAGGRRQRLAKLSQGVLVELANALLEDADRELVRGRAELAQRDYYIERLEALLERSIDRG